jgi:hypothetical protein
MCQKPPPRSAQFDCGDKKIEAMFVQPDATRMRMLRQLLVGAAVSALNIAIHALVMTSVVKVAHALTAGKTSQSALLLPSVMIGTMSVLMAAHVCEIGVWALAYLTVDAVPEGTGLLYFAFVNYTTLGYGDVVPLPDWELLGPFTAMTGILMFGWSTAVMFEVLRRTMATDIDGGH